MNSPSGNRLLGCLYVELATTFVDGKKTERIKGGALAITMPRNKNDFCVQKIFATLV